MDFVPDESAVNTELIEVRNTALWTLLSLVTLMFQFSGLVGICWRSKPYSAASHMLCNSRLGRGCGLHRVAAQDCKCSS